MVKAQAAPRTAGGHNDARIIACMGASGMGKGRTTKEEILPDLAGSIVIVWSPLEETDEYARVLKCKARSSLTDVIADYRAGKSSVYVPTLERKQMAACFDLFCRAVWYMPGAVVIVEELRQVTSPSYAPPAWARLSTAGRHRGLTIIGNSQRPAQIDKDFLGNCSEIRCFRLVYEEDARTVASVLREPWAGLLDLPAFHYIRRVIETRVNTFNAVGRGIIPRDPPAAVQRGQSSAIVRLPMPTKFDRITMVPAANPVTKVTPRKKNQAKKGARAPEKTRKTR